MFHKLSIRNDMQSKYINHQQNTCLEIPTADLRQINHGNSVKQPRVFVFDVNFRGKMDMHSDVETVAEYLNAHEGWFCRCAHPMKVNPLKENGYVLTIGKYGSFGYEVEPKIGIVLNPPVDRVYRMHTIPIPDLDSMGYEVNYDAVMKLQEISINSASRFNNGLFSSQMNLSCITQVTWELDLKVEVEFPQFISKLSPRLIQLTGDKLLAQIVRQVSPRLTYKVQKDFHSSHNLPLPPKSSRQLEQVVKANEYAA